MYQGKFYFEDSSFKLIENDTFKTLTNFEEKTFKARKTSNTETFRNTRKNNIGINK